MKRFSDASVLAAIAFSLYVTTPAQSAPKVEKPECAATTEFPVADFSMPLTNLIASPGKSGLDALKEFGVTTIFRYYDLPKETIACKTLLPEEADAIVAKGMKLGVVFQNNSDDPATFIVSENTGKAHAQRALDLAAHNGQPLGSVIYFGMDGADLHLEEVEALYRRYQGGPLPPKVKDDFINDKKANRIKWYEEFVTYRNKNFKPQDKITAQSMQFFLRRYLENVRAVFKKHAESHSGQTYKIGLYCTGGICDYAKTSSAGPLADYYWVTAEGRDLPEYSRFVDKGEWNLLQQRETKCPTWKSKKVSFDFNRASPQGDVGSWIPNKSERVPLPRPLRCPAH
jgi:hypothetical protein